LLKAPGIAKLHIDIREKGLDQNWDRVFSLDPYLQEEADHAAFQELIVGAIRRIKIAGWTSGVSHKFYADFYEGARATPPFRDGADWQAVAWPFIQVAMVPMLRDRLDKSQPLLKALGW
jgi:hypothetical protein